VWGGLGVYVDLIHARARPNTCQGQGLIHAQGPITICICMHAYMRMYAYIHMFINIHAYVCIHVCIYAYSHAYICIHIMCMHTYMYCCSYPSGTI